MSQSSVFSQWNALVMLLEFECTTQQFSTVRRFWLSLIRLYGHNLPLPRVTHNPLLKLAPIDEDVMFFWNTRDCSLEVVIDSFGAIEFLRDAGQNPVYVKTYAEDPEMFTKVWDQFSQALQELYNIRVNP